MTFIQSTERERERERQAIKVRDIRCYNVNFNTRLEFEKISHIDHIEITLWLVMMSLRFIQNTESGEASAK
jgi:hypothetical protein